MLNFLTEIVKDIFTNLGLEGDPIIKPSEPIYGDYQVNGVIAIAKKNKRDPLELAQKVIDQLPKTVFKETGIAGPGFINLRLNEKFLASNLPKFLEIKPQKLITVIDYSSPNLAKEMHVGHLRSTIIGDSLVKIHRFLGNKVIKRNHVGDWGTQFGMLLAYMSTMSSEEIAVELKDLENFYRQAKIRFDNDPEFAKSAHHYVNLLQQKTEKIYDLWRKFIKISIEHCQEIYRRLEVELEENDIWGESRYNDQLPTIVDELLNKQIAVINNGAICVFFEPKELPSDSTPFIIRKQDGSYLYATTDLAAAYDRIDNLKADLILYVIDARQSLHMQQLFCTLRKANKLNHTKCEHIAFGVMLGQDGKPFKTRSGGTIKLNELLDEAEKRALSLLKERNCTVDDLTNLAKKLGIAAIKYADLAKNRLSNYQFDFDKMLAFEGNTANYLLYALVRIKSLLRKVNNKQPVENRLSITNEYERNLVLKLITFRETIEKAAKESSPHLICNYLYNLANEFMRFYENCNIISVNTRIYLTKIVEKILSTGLSLLGIPLIEQM